MTTERNYCLQMMPCVNGSRRIKNTSRDTMMANVGVMVLARILDLPSHG